MEYTIIIGENVTDLMSKVREALESNWIPQGGVCAATVQEFCGRDEPDEIIYVMQAMIRK